VVRTARFKIEPDCNGFTGMLSSKRPGIFGQRLTGFRRANYDASNSMSHATITWKIVIEISAQLPIRRIAGRCWLIVIVALLCIVGCDQSEPQPPANHSAAVSEQATTELRLAIVDDPALATSIGRLQGEWTAQTAAKLTVQQLSAEAIASAEKLDADAIIYPPGLLGMLAERKLIRPLNQAWLASDPLESADLLQPLDSLELTWDGQPYAVPLGSPVFVLLYRPDLFELFAKQPPRTWEEYQQLADFFNNADQLKKKLSARHADAAELNVAQPWSGTIEPLAPGWASRLLVARSAAYAKHRDYSSVLFDRETMEPLIAGPPFVRALSELATAAKTGPKDAVPLTPADAAKSFLAGHAAMAIAWPTSSAPAQLSLTGKGAKVLAGVAVLPGSSTAYNPRHTAWEPRRSDESTSIPLRGVSGRIGSIVRGATAAESAFRLLTWLASQRWSTEVLPASSATTMFRQSQLLDPSAWTGPMFSLEAAKEYGQVLSAALREPEAVSMLRLPGEVEYMAALDDAVHATVDGKQSPQQALDAAAAKWREITARFGKQQQLEAYRRSLKIAQ
jgi:ABC-type glycerol-3-phosphate transport system substrate-binding protein